MKNDFHIFFFLYLAEILLLEGWPEVIAAVCLALIYHFQIQNEKKKDRQLRLNASFD